MALGFFNNDRVSSIVNAQGTAELIPQGLYLGYVSISEVSAGKAGGQYLHLQYTIVGGESAKRRISQYINFSDTDFSISQTIKVAQILGYDIEQLEHIDSRASTMLGRNALIKVIHRLGDNGKTYANVQYISPLEEAEEPLRERLNERLSEEVVTDADIQKSQGCSIADLSLQQVAKLLQQLDKGTVNTTKIITEANIDLKI